MTTSLIVNCYLNPSKISELFGVIKKFSECTIVKFEELNAGYKVNKETDAVVISDLKLEKLTLPIEPCLREPLI